VAVVLAVLAVAVAVVMADPMGVNTDETAVGWREDATEEDLAPPADRPAGPTTSTPGPTTTQPPTTTTAPPVRLAPAPVAPAERGFHSFIAREDDGDPIAWDPCETIQFVVNSRLAPPGAAEILSEAIGQVTAASGLVFEDRGATDEAPVITRGMRDEARYGEGWSPVLVAWTDEAEQSELAGLVAGVASPYWVSTSHGESEHVTGLVHLDGPDFQGLLDAGRRSEAVRVVMHELGHLVGLDHVEDTTQVMYHNRDGRGLADAAWGVGDLGGLAAAGSGDCDPDY
jgi:hypothetical protein